MVKMPYSTVLPSTVTSLCQPEIRHGGKIYTVEIRKSYKLGSLLLLLESLQFCDLPPPQPATPTSVKESSSAQRDARRGPDL